MLSRSQVINRFLRLFDRPSYLEIGVDRGQTFNEVHASLKTGVDPKFAFDTTAWQADQSVEFHEITSDEFFAATVQNGKRFDVIYLDGLHTFEQTLRDLLNAVAVRRRNGVIIIDDVLPNSFDASLPDFNQVAELRQAATRIKVIWPFDGSWMGDVFKLPFFIESFLQQFSYATVAENHGQTVVWQQARPAGGMPKRSLEQIARLDYRDTILQRASFRVLNLEAIVALVEVASAH